MKPAMLILIFSAALMGCQQDSAITSDILVYENTGARQCEPGSGVTLADSAAGLAEAEVTVLASDCGELTGVAFPAACGMGTGAIIIHRIPASERATAEQMGFRPVSELINDAQGVGYQKVACPPVEE